MNRYFGLYILSVASLVAGCASQGRPGGGPRDTEPPGYVHSIPANGQLNYSNRRLTLTFDENIQLTEPNAKIVVSPAQNEMPRISSNGRKITIELQDTLLPNTTYTVDFGNSISDLNEGNKLDGFAIDFSTGSSRDSLRISGMVLAGRNLEPAQGMLVGAYISAADSAISTLRFDRISRTNSLGQFTLRNLQDTTYHIFAVDDRNRDYHWDRSESVAFYGPGVRPTAHREVITDTIAADSLSSRTETIFLPDDLLLTWFNENYKAHYIKDYKRTERNILYLKFNAPADSMPQLHIVQRGSQAVDIDLMNVARLQRSQLGDSLLYWLTDDALIASDSLLIAARYRRPDSLNVMAWTTDTLKFNIRSPKKKVAETSSTPSTPPLLGLKLASSTQELNLPLRFLAQEPIAHLNREGFHLMQKVDTLWIPAKSKVEIIGPDSLLLTQMELRCRWEPGTQYRLDIDSMAVTNLYGVYNGHLELPLTTRKLDDYSTLSFTVTGVPSSLQAVVELLDGKDTPLQQLPLKDGRVTFTHLLPDTYYARLFIDADCNGEWTNGNLAARHQPEDVYYYPKSLNIKKNWDRSEAWDIQALPPDLQKPFDIKQNRPELPPGSRPETSNYNEDEEEDDSF